MMGVRWPGSRTASNGNPSRCCRRPGSGRWQRSSMMDIGAVSAPAQQQRGVGGFFGAHAPRFAPGRPRFRCGMTGAVTTSPLSLSNSRMAMRLPMLSRVTSRKMRAPLESSARVDGGLLGLRVAAGRLAGFHLSAPLGGEPGSDGRRGRCSVPGRRARCRPAARLARVGSRRPCGFPAWRCGPAVWPNTRLARRAVAPRCGPHPVATTGSATPSSLMRPAGC